MKINKLISIVALALAGSALAQPVNQADVAGNSGPIDQKHIGDTNQVQSDVTTKTDMMGNANASMGNTISPTITTDVRNQATGGEGGSSIATGGKADGNTSTNNNQTNATTGASTSQGGSVGFIGSTTGTNTSTNTSKVGVNSANNSAANGGSSKQAQGIDTSGNSQTRTNVNASDNSVYNNRTVVHAPSIPGPAAPAIASGNMIHVPGECGPRAIVISHKVTGVSRGAWGGKDYVDQGYDQELVDDPVPFLIINGHEYGHAVTTVYTKIGVSYAASLNLGFYGKDQQGAQGGGGGSTNMERLVRSYTLRTCLIPKEKQAVIPQQTFVPAPRQDRN